MSILKYLAKKAIKIAATAAVFGLVAGSTFVGVTEVWNTQTETTTSEETSSSDSSLTTTSTSSTSSSGVVATTDTSATDVSTVVENVMPSIVAITAVSVEEYQTMFGQGQTYESESAGSGIIVGQDDEYLYIVTNNHVVSGSTSLTVQFVDDSTASATITGTSSSNDLAVVQVAISDLSEDTISSIAVATLGDSDEVQVGDTAIAIGNALGYGQSVTTGVISALNREVTTTDSTTNETVTASLIQTDAAINPGNSGGALLNANGEVIGINSSKYSDTSVEGMGFAIPINTAKEIINAIIDGTLEDLEGQAGYLGISGIDVSSDVSSTYNMPEGVYIAKVASGSAAEAAGLQEGQIITAIDDTEITSATQLASVISSYSGGDTVTVTVMTSNNGQYVESQVEVTLGYASDKETE